MSNLLEALKKAQAEKLSFNGDEDQSPQQEKQTKTSTIAEEDLVLLLNKTDEAKINKTVSLDDSEPKLTQKTDIERSMEATSNPERDLNRDELNNQAQTEDEITNLTFDQNTPSFSLSFLEEGPAGKNDQDSSIEVSELEKPSSMEELHLTSLADEVLDESAMETTEPTAKSKKTSHQGLETPELQLKAEENLETAPVDQTEEVPQKEVEEAEKEDVKKVENIAQQLDLSTDEPVKEERLNAHNKESMDNEQKTTQTSNQTNKQESDSSYDWSLSQIPGFEMETKSSNSDNNQNNKDNKNNESEESKNYVSLLQKSQQMKPGKKRGPLNKALLFLLFAITILLMVAYFVWEYLKNIQTQTNLEVMTYQNKLNEIASETKVKAPVAMPNNQKTNVSASTPLQEATPTKKVIPSQQQAKGKSTPEKPKVIKNKKIESKAKIIKQEPLSKTPQIKKENQKTTKNLSNAQEQVQIQSKTEKDLRLQAYEAFQQGDYAQSQQLYRKAALKYPRDINVWLGLGATSLALGENEAALKYYQQALKLGSTNFDANKAVAMLTSQKDQNWLMQVKNLWLSAPNDPDINFMLGSYYAQKEDWLQAKKYFKAAASISPNAPEIVLNYAVALDHLGDYVEAIRYYQKALALKSYQDSLISQESIKKRIQLLQQFLAKTSKESQ
ncbi:tetratricopeptide repeat protein [Galenea microaerophila]